MCKNFIAIQELKTKNNPNVRRLAKLITSHKTDYHTALKELHTHRRGKAPFVVS